MEAGHRSDRRRRRRQESEEQAEEMPDVPIHCSVASPRERHLHRRGAREETQPPGQEEEL